jgi:DNA-directed RNA polymerase specialized sigma24 family protein
LNKRRPRAVFIIEGKRLLMGEAILSEAAPVPRSRVCSRDGALEELVRQYAQLIYRISYAALRSQPDAEDATQETFLRVLRYSHKLATVENPKTWLARIAWRVAVERYKRQGRRREIPLQNLRSRFWKCRRGKRRQMRLCTVRKLAVNWND